MVQFADKVLKGSSRLNKARGFASDDVVVVDPAMGTGTFLVEILNSVVETLQTERRSPAIPRSHLRELFANRLVGFELQVAPFAIAELRLHYALKRRYGIDLPRDEVRFLSNALDDPNELPLPYGQLYEPFREAREGANNIKRHVPVMVVIGNPPWREQARGEAPWVERRRNRQLPSHDFRDRPSLDEFRAPAQSRRSFKLSNMWTYFWRWATWKVFDANPTDPAGIVLLITPSAYLASSAHAGMRRYLRETSDEGWVVDLTPEGFQPPTSTRVFPGVQQPICVGIFARYGPPRRDTPAKVRHRALHGSQQEKFETLLTLSPDDDSWEEIPADWESPFRPSDSVWTSCPEVADLLPWHLPGVKPNRRWVYAPDRETLRRRWSRLIHADDDDKPKLFKETSDRKISSVLPSLAEVPSREQALLAERKEEPTVVPIGYRSFDRHYLILDRRTIDRPRPELWQVHGPRQIYAVELHTHAITAGPALTFSALVPDQDYFLGHHGGRVTPLYRDREGVTENVAPLLLSTLEDYLGLRLRAEDILAYIAAVVAHPGYTRTFCEELKSPSVRVPLSRDSMLWQETIQIGSEVLWLHTLGERFYDDDAGRPYGAPLLPPPSRPVVVEPIPASDDQMPDEFVYVSETETLIVGTDTLLTRAGRIERVSPAVWEYTVGGGVPVVRRWLKSRLRSQPGKRRTSPLDDIGPTRWTAEFDDELLTVLNALGRCVALEPQQADLLNRVYEGGLITVGDLEHHGVLPIRDTCRRAPRSSVQAGLLPTPTVQD